MVGHHFEAETRVLLYHYVGTGKYDIVEVDLGGLKVHAVMHGNCRLVDQPASPPYSKHVTTMGPLDFYLPCKEE